MMDWGGEAQRRLQAIAGISEPGPGVTRLPFTPEHQAARGMIAGWMKAAGMDVHLDAAATLIGRKGPRDAPTFLIGSHQDTVRSGGAYDGIMGVALGCLAVERLAAEGVSLPFAVEVLAFADEEGVRFPTALLGPRALAGTYDPAVLEMTDRGGIRLADALEDAGGSAAGLAGLARTPGSVLGYLEAHIEQGPVLEAGGAAIGVVTGICGIERNAVTIHGQTGHAGTVPMKMRTDALVTAARLIAEVDAMARDTPGVLATVGSIDCAPNVVNAIPDKCSLTIEIRSADDAARRAFSSRITVLCGGLARSRATPVEVAKTYEQGAVDCDPALVSVLQAAAPDAPALPSGATHDASAMADLCPISMLFVRCRGGISHSPEEYASAEDMGAAIRAMVRFLSALESR